MMTVKVLMPGPGMHEQIYEAARVWTENHPAQESGRGTRRIVYVANSVGETIARLDPTDLGDQAVVYVMNDAGQTISRYELQPRNPAFRYPPAPTDDELKPIAAQPEPVLMRDAQAVVGALRRQPQFPAPPTGFKPSVGGSAVVRPVRSDRRAK